MGLHLGRNHGRGSLQRHPCPAHRERVPRPQRHALPAKVEQRAHVHGQGIARSGNLNVDPTVPVARARVGRIHPHDDARQGVYAGGFKEALPHAGPLLCQRSGPPRSTENKQTTEEGEETIHGETSRL
jgi:hypothetical protein